MTTAVFKHIDPTTYTGTPWATRDQTDTNFKHTDVERKVHDIRETANDFNVDTAGFAFYSHELPKDREWDFEDEDQLRNHYFPLCEALLKEKIPGVKKVIPFSNVVRRQKSDYKYQPAMRLHVDQTHKAAALHVWRNLPPEQARELIKGRYLIVNIWRPIGSPVLQTPLAMVDWRTTKPEDFRIVQLFPRDEEVEDPNSGLDAKGQPVYNAAHPLQADQPVDQVYAISPNPDHKFYYAKNITPDEVLFIKNFDSRGADKSQGDVDTAVYAAHSAFKDPASPENSPFRQSVETRFLLFIE